MKQEDPPTPESVTYVASWQMKEETDDDDDGEYQRKLPAVAAAAVSPDMTNKTSNNDEDAQGNNIQEVGNSMASAAKRDLSFPMKLLSILDQSESDPKVFQMISWVRKGKAFQVHDVKEFSATIMPDYFNDDRFYTFYQEMRSYGFESVQGTRLCYRHPQFLRHNRRQCHLLDIPTSSKSDSSFQQNRGSATTKKKINSADDSETNQRNIPAMPAAASSRLHNQSINSKQDNRATGDKRKLYFPIKMWELLNDSEKHGWTETVSWVHDGKALKVLDTDEWYKEIVPRYFIRPIKFKSVVRSLHKYGFSNIGNEKGVYTHPLFSRCNRAQCQEMEKQKKGKKRKKQTNTSKDLAADDLHASSELTNHKEALNKRNRASKPKQVAKNNATGDLPQKRTRRSVAVSVSSNDVQEHSQDDSDEDLNLPAKRSKSSWAAVDTSNSTSGELEEANQTVDKNVLSPADSRGGGTNAGSSVPMVTPKQVELGQNGAVHDDDLGSSAREAEILSRRSKLSKLLKLRQETNAESGEDDAICIRIKNQIDRLDNQLIDIITI